MSRVLHVIDHTGDGGAQVVVLNLIRALADRFDLGVAVLGKSGQFSDAYEALGIPVFALGDTVSRWNVWPFVRLVNTIHQNKFDLIHTHLFKANILGTVAAKYAGVRTILHDHCGVFPENLAYYFSNRLLSGSYVAVYRRLLRLCDRVVVLTKADAQSYSELYNLQPQMMTVLPNAVDLGQFKRLTKLHGALALKEQLGVSDNTRLVVMVGRLHRVKDWITFLEVAKLLEQRSDPSCAFLVIGSGSEEKALRRFVDDNGLKQVFFLGYRSDVLGLLQQADVLLLTSRRETFAVVLLEAMASGCPVVSTRSRGPQSIITHEVNGLLCDIGDAQGLSDQLLRLLVDQALRARIVSQARQTVRQSYDLEQVSLRLAAVYEDVLGHELL